MLHTIYGTVALGTGGRKLFANAVNSFHLSGFEQQMRWEANTPNWLLTELLKRKIAWRVCPMENAD